MLNYVEEAIGNGLLVNELLNFMKTPLRMVMTDKEPIREKIHVKTNTFVCPKRGAKWNISTITIAITNATYSKNAG